jgi:tetratricopeptide (TPR) repeat protein
MGPSVSVTHASVELPTYALAAPDRYPQFLEKRVYQGSSGRVYPLAVCDRIAAEPQSRAWQAVFIENEYLRVMILPELGGRIHRIVDKIREHDLIYYQPVIKPALVGLAGPWVSGGIEFNWPQHHRPSTTMPATVSVEQDEDGSATVWLSEHDPMARMKGMHGVCLHPGVARLELRVRVYNRTDDVQTFLWWANAGLEAHEQVQSFFPPDVAYVADHAKRAMSTFPLCEGRYYGVDYAARARAGVPAREIPRNYYPPQGGDGSTPPPNDLSWYANIPVPTSYMCVGSKGDFCGAYDHRARVGLVHVADHHIAPGKKQWTWGNHEFGYAWDRNLTDARDDGSFPPYIELMAGVFTDNQPDFSFLQPGETKTWTQHWYPIHDIGVPRQANEDAAIDLRGPGRDRRLEARVSVTRSFPAAQVQLIGAEGRVVAQVTEDLAPGQAAIVPFELARGRRATGLQLVVRNRDGREIIRYRPQETVRGEPPAPAQPAPLPPEVPSTDELFIIGLHLEQYRHAIRCPTLYWREALRRDPGDSRCNLALGRWYLRRGEFESAEPYLRTSLARLTSRNPNPADGEAYYQLGRCLRYLNRHEEAIAAYGKAIWNQAWAGMAHLALAEMEISRGRWAEADDHLTRARRLDEDNLRVRNLQAIVYGRCGLEDLRRSTLDDLLATDSQDAWANWQRHGKMVDDNQLRLDVAHDFARAGLWTEALEVLESAPSDSAGGTSPLVNYTRAWLSENAGRSADAARQRKAARQGSADRCFPARLEEQAVLEAAIAADARDARARRLRGFWLYDRRRHEEAITHWEVAVRLDPKDAVVWRCLGIAYFNIRHQPTRARRAYDRAIQAAPKDARLHYERDQLWKRLGVKPSVRLAALRKVRPYVEQRDDLAVEFAALLNQTGRPGEALELLESRVFQPWEGGEGQASREYVRARLLLGRAALARGDAAGACEQFSAGLEIPANLGEARHLLVNPSEVQWWLGEATAALGDPKAARAHWKAAATFKGDFQGMQVRAFSETTCFTARAMQRLGHLARARSLFEALLAYARDLAATPAAIDYFATSLPTMLLFDDDLDRRQRFTARLIEAQARLGLGQKTKAIALLDALLLEDPSSAVAADLRADLRRDEPRMTRKKTERSPAGSIEETD